MRQARGCSSVGRPHDRLTQGMPVPETSLARRGRLHLHPLATCTCRLLRSPHVAAGHVDAEPDTSSPDPERRSNPSSFILRCGRAAVVCGDVRLALNGALLLVNSGGAGLVHTGTGDAKEGEPGTPKGRRRDAAWTDAEPRRLVFAGGGSPRCPQPSRARLPVITPGVIMTGKRQPRRGEGKKRAIFRKP